MALLSWKGNKIEDLELVRIYSYLEKKFSFNPKDIFVEILPLREFEDLYVREKKEKAPWFVVGYALSNGRIVILSKDDFPKKEHSPNEFEKVACHEMCHIFVRRILWPKTTFRWIEEGVCEYFSFGSIDKPLENIISFNNLRTKEQWRKNPAYSQSREFFSFLDRTFGTKKIVDWIKKIKEKSEEDAFEEIFEIPLKEAQKTFLEVSSKQL